MSIPGYQQAFNNALLGSQLHQQNQLQQMQGLQNIFTDCTSVGAASSMTAKQYLCHQQQVQQVVKSKEKSMFKEVTTDIKSFILEHRGVIYFVVAALIVDHFFFKGAFKARLQAMADKMVSKVEEKIK